MSSIQIKRTHNHNKDHHLFHPQQTGQRFSLLPGSVLGTSPLCVHNRAEQHTVLEPLSKFSTKRLTTPGWVPLLITFDYKEEIVVTKSSARWQDFARRTTRPRKPQHAGDGSQSNCRWWRYHMAGTEPAWERRDGSLLCTFTHPHVVLLLLLLQRERETSISKANVARWTRP